MGQTIDEQNNYSRPVTGPRKVEDAAKELKLQRQPGRRFFHNIILKPMSARILDTLVFQEPAQVSSAVHFSIIKFPVRMEPFIGLGYILLDTVCDGYALIRNEYEVIYRSRGLFTPI